MTRRGSNGGRGPRNLLRASIAAAAAAATAAASAAPQCSVSTNARLDFGTVIALESTGDRTTDSAGSFWINCNSEVTAAPRLYSGTARVMQYGAMSLPFRLSLVAPGAGDLPAATPGAPLAFPRDGTNQTVTLYGAIRAADFKALPPGLYSTSVSLTVEY
ncbi:MAG TPA: spore coat protein U domain-containing protein [Ramlibacter sp.]|uniref:spore coat protein U domain-containing protein n=1 Tax=Ramlibacter sp. TaxID=1917967 RepID=UPI002CFBE16E|nr:spore coat protein U domain-containing protein [Ramlibacter sp.]HVZ45629.1 spore coat protein U domain-containing protein [Ramlibacter sp.]